MEMKNVIKRFSEPEQFRTHTLKAANVQMEKELRRQFLREGGHDGE